jgi:asparagine synthase (glutamine-hydrolysing)
MCGIAGFIGEDKTRIERMTKALIHRGPDGNATEVSHGVSLGHARLAILDPRPDGDQPMWNDARTIVIVFNGEIYNYQALRQAEQFDCRTGTDTEVILKMYEKYGIDCVQYLRGMFAFGLYDTRSQTMHLARDTSGIKPLYLSSIDGRIHFASEMRSLMTAFKAKPALNMRSLSRYLRLQYVPGPETMCEGIESLTPGTIVTVAGGKETRRTFKTAVAPMTFKNSADFSAGTRAVIYPDSESLKSLDELATTKPPSDSTAFVIVSAV